MRDERTVLVVDDDEAILELMRDFLEAEGLRVEGAVDARAAQTVLDRAAVDCILLDIMLPGASGFDLCRRVRATNNVPILFLSARDEDADKIRGLGLGADDYIVKTATPPEVVARVKAALRRYRGSAAPAAVHLTFERLTVDARAHEVFIDGRKTPFTPREFDLLCLFAEHPRQVFTYEQLIEHFWGGVGDRHTVTVHIRRIREKIEEDPKQPRLIVNVWGVGYRFEGIRA